MVDTKLMLHMSAIQGILGLAVGTGMMISLVTSDADLGSLLMVALGTLIMLYSISPVMAIINGMVIGKEIEDTKDAALTSAAASVIGLLAMAICLIITLSIGSAIADTPDDDGDSGSFDAGETFLEILIVSVPVAIAGAGSAILCNNREHESMMVHSLPDNYPAMPTTAPQQTQSYTPPVPPGLQAQPQQPQQQYDQSQWQRPPGY